MFVCDALSDLVPFVQFKKCKKHPWRSASFSKVVGFYPATLLTGTRLHECFSRFLNSINGSKSRNASQLHVVTEYHAVSARYDPACPKFSEITDCQYLWKRLSDFVDFLHVVYMLLDIHWSYKNISFWVGIVRHGLSANLIAKCFKFKKYQVDFLHVVSRLPLKLQKYYSWVGYDPKIILASANQFAGFFTFDLFDLLISIPEVYCYIALVCLMYLFDFTVFDLTFWNPVVKTIVTNLRFSKFNFFFSIFNLNSTIVIFKEPENLLNATDVTTYKSYAATFTSKC